MALAAAGAELVLVSRTASQLEEVAAEIARQGGRAQVLPLDVTDSAAVGGAFAGLGRLDILVNNAGLNRPQPFLDVDEATLDRLLTLNVRAAFLVAQAAARLMVAKWRRERQAASSSTCPRRWAMSVPSAIARSM